MAPDSHAVNDQRDQAQTGQRAPASTAHSWLTVVDCCNSSNDWCRDHSTQLAHGSVVWALRQVAGRGQYGRSWLAPEGTLTWSMLVRCRRQYLPLLSLVAGLAVTEACNEVLDEAGVSSRSCIKWPNDIYLKDCKLAGILCESRHPGQLSDDHCEVIIGIGLNANADFDANGPTAAMGATMARPPISLHAVSGAAVEGQPLLARIRSLILEGLGMLQAQRWQLLWERLRDYDWLLGRSIVVEPAHGPVISGQAAGITNEGHLMVTFPDGGMTTISSGTVRSMEHSPPPSSTAAEQGPWDR